MTKIKDYHVSLSKKGRNSKKYSKMFGYSYIYVKALNKEGAKLASLKKKKILKKFGDLSYLKAEII